MDGQAPDEEGGGTHSFANTPLKAAQAPLEMAYASHGVLVPIAAGSEEHGRGDGSVYEWGGGCGGETAEGRRGSAAASMVMGAGGGFGEGLAVRWRSMGSGERWTGWMGKEVRLGCWFAVSRIGGGLGGELWMHWMVRYEYLRLQTLQSFSFSSDPEKCYELVTWNAGSA